MPYERPLPTVDSASASSGEVAGLRMTRSDCQTWKAVVSRDVLGKRRIALPTSR